MGTAGFMGWSPENWSTPKSYDWRCMAVLYVNWNHIYIIIYMYMWIYVYMYICIYVYMYIYMYICIYVYIYIYLYICIYVYMYICMYVCIYIYVLYSKIIVDGLLKATFWLLRPSVPWCLTKQTHGLQKDLQNTEVLRRNFDQKYPAPKTSPANHSIHFRLRTGQCGKVSWTSPAAASYSMASGFVQTKPDGSSEISAFSEQLIISNGIIDESTSKNVLDQLSKGIRKIHGPCKVMPPKLCLLVYTPN